MQVTISISFDTERDGDILSYITWLKANKPRQVSAWAREKIRAGMAREGELEQKIDRILALLESGAVVQVARPQAGDGRKIGALDKLGL